MLPSKPLTTVTIPAAYGLALLNLMVERGHSEAPLLAGSDLTRATLQDQHAQMGAWQYATLLHNALQADGDAGLAYELGLRSQVTKHGFVGFGLISCATLREAIDFSQRYFQARVPLFRSALRVEPPYAVITLQETIPLGPQYPLVMDMALVELCSLFAKVLGLDPSTAGWTSEIDVPYAEPAAYARYQHRLPRFHFNQPAVQIRFPVDLLDEPIATADAVSVQLAIDRCEQDLARRAPPSTVSAQVSARLTCQGGRYPDIADMAQQLLMSERTLKRRLQDEGTGFQALLDHARQQQAMRLLRQPKLAIKQVAEAVGYGDPANFARAFYKWTGMTPRQWRQQAGAADASGPN
jgi:AraC-like DNA-binding protein